MQYMLFLGQDVLKIVYHWVVAYTIQIRCSAKGKLIFRVQLIFRKEVLAAGFIEACSMTKFRQPLTGTI